MGWGIFSGLQDALGGVADAVIEPVNKAIESTQQAVDHTILDPIQQATGLTPAQLALLAAGGYFLGPGLMAGAGAGAAGAGAADAGLLGGLGAAGTDYGASYLGGLGGIGSTAGAADLGASLGAGGLGSAGATDAYLASLGYAGPSTAATSAPGLLSQAGSYLTQPSTLAGIANMASGFLNQNAASNAARQSADAQVRAAQIAADAAKFKPVGVTTNMGSSKFGYDNNGNLISAGYNLNPQLQAQQDALLSTQGGLLGQFLNSQSATAPMTQAAQSAMSLGNQYLGANPQDQAAKYMANQQALLAPSNAQQLAQIRANLAATGRSGLALGGDAGMAASNPELQAYYNSLTQQNNQLAANADQAGMNYAQFGANLAGQGGNLLTGAYNAQSSAANPYQTSLGLSNTIEGMGQNALDLGTSIGAKTSTNAANAGNYLSQGVINAANTMQPTNAYSGWGAALGGLGGMLTNFKP